MSGDADMDTGEDRTLEWERQMSHVVPGHLPVLAYLNNTPRPLTLNFVKENSTGTGPTFLVHLRGLIESDVRRAKQTPVTR